MCDATLAFIKRCNFLSVIIGVADFREQCACIKFCLKFGKTYRMLRNVEDSFWGTSYGSFLNISVLFQFKASRTLWSTSVQIICEDRHHTIDEVSMLVGISHGTCHKNFYRRSEDATCRIGVHAQTPEY